MEPNLAIFCNQARLLVVRLGYQLSYKTYNLSCLQDTLGQWWHRICGSSQPMTGATCDPYHIREPIPDTAWMVRNHR